MIPMFLLGVLVFYGIERVSYIKYSPENSSHKQYYFNKEYFLLLSQESFNLVLYPTLMLVFLILLRYGSEAALLANDWEQHKIDQTPELVFTLIQDIIFIGLLFLYVYVCLAFTPIKPTPMELLETGNAAFQSAVQPGNVRPAETNNLEQQFLPVPVQQPIEPVPQSSQQLQLLSVNMDSQGFNYDARRNIDQKAKEVVVEVKPPVPDEIDRQRQQPALPPKAKGSKSWFGWGSGGGSAVKETDIDAVAPAVSVVASVPQQQTEQVPVLVEQLSKPEVEVLQPAPNVTHVVESAPAPQVTFAIAPVPDPAVEPEPVAAPVVEPVAPPEAPAPVKLNKSRIAAARKKLADTQKEPEKPAPAEPTEPELDFWGTMNGEQDQSTSAKSESFKQTAV